MKKTLIIISALLVLTIIMEVFLLGKAKTENGYSAVVVSIIFSVIVLIISFLMLFSEIKSEQKKKKEEVSNFALNHGSGYLPNKME